MRHLLLMMTVVVVCSCFQQPTSSSSPQITIAAAANLQDVIYQIKTLFEARYSVQVDIVLGASGNLFAQTKMGAPYDIFFSADEHYPQLLYQQKYTAISPKVYAIGALVLWWRKELHLEVPKTIELLMSTEVKKIAIANPHYAPYGKRTQESLIHYKLWQKIQPKLVIGKSISQAAQFAETGNAEVAIISLSLAMTQKMQQQGDFLVIATSSHTPLRQSFVVLQQNPISNKFVNFIAQVPIKKVFTKYGYTIPNKESE